MVPEAAQPHSTNINQLELVRYIFTAQKEKLISKEKYQKALAYIRENKGIKEVILSGGDPYIV